MSLEAGEQCPMGPLGPAGPGDEMKTLGIDCYGQTPHRSKGRGDPSCFPIYPEKPCFSARMHYTF